MEVSYKDSAFGEMTYKHRWYKRQLISLFGKKWNITIAAKAYSRKPITEAQQNSYMNFWKNKDEMANIIAEKLREYINTNIQELAAYWVGARTVNSIKELTQMTTPKTLLFKQDGATIMLLDCVWDEDHGVAVKLTPNVAVGSQDLFL